MDRVVRHTRKKIRINDIVVPLSIPSTTEICVSRPPAGKKKVVNLYYDPETAEVVLVIED